MTYSYEEVYFEHGQVDRFVQVYFHSDSESYKIFGPDYLMGQFKFTDDEITELEKIRHIKPMARNQAKVKFYPAEYHSFSEEILTMLDRDGFLCSDITSVFKFDTPKENRYTKKGIKEVPHTINVEIGNFNLDVEFAMLDILSKRIKRGCVLPDFEWNKFYGLLLYYRPEEIVEDKKIYSNYDTKELDLNIKYHLLETKVNKNKANDSEVEEFKSLRRKHVEINQNLIFAELKRGVKNDSELGKINISKYNMLACCFEDEVLVHGTPSIWWDAERHFHIFLRHVKEFQFGENFKEKSVFQYSLKGIKRVIKIVIELAFKEIVEHFKNNPTRMFSMRNSRAIPYDGNFYRIDVEPSGRLFTFHPYRNYQEATEDNS